VTYAPQQLWADITAVAYGLGWGLDDILDLEHADRQRLVALIADHERR